MQDIRRVVLVGFSGSGKTTVSLLLAARLNWRPVDIDLDIEIDAGKTIPEAIALEAVRRVSTRGIQGPLEEALRQAGGVKAMESCGTRP